MILDFRFRSTRYCLLPARDGAFMAFDAGWPCDLHGYARALKATGAAFERVKWAMVSHFHLDHAGLVRDFQDAGIQCLVFEGQLGAIEAMEELLGRKYPAYRPIRREALLACGSAASRDFLASLGIQAEVLPTPGHSDDSFSLLTDDHEACIGDLYPLAQVAGEDTKSLASWDLLKRKGARHILPSHAEAFEL